MNRKEVIDYLVRNKKDKSTDYSGFAIFRTKDMKFKRMDSVDFSLNYFFFEIDLWSKDIKKAKLIGTPFPKEFICKNPGEVFVVQFDDFKVVDVMDISLLDEYAAIEFFNCYGDIKKTFDYLKKTYYLTDENAEKFFDGESKEFNPKVIDEFYFGYLAKKCFENNSPSCEIASEMAEVSSITNKTVHEAANKSIKGVILRKIGNSIKNVNMPYEPRLLHDTSHSLNVYIDKKLFFELVFIDSILKIRVLREDYVYQDVENLKDFIKKFYQEVDRLEYIKNKRVENERGLISKNIKKLEKICNNNNCILNHIGEHIYNIVYVVERPIERPNCSLNDKIKFTFTVPLTNFINKGELDFSKLFDIINAIGVQLNLYEYYEQFCATILFKKEWIL